MRCIPRYYGIRIGIKYKDNFETLKEYAFTHFADDKNSEWYKYISYKQMCEASLDESVYDKES